MKKAKQAAPKKAPTKEWHVHTAHGMAPERVSAHGYHVTADGRLAFTVKDGANPVALFHSWLWVKALQ